MYLIHRVRVATAETINIALADLDLNGTLSMLLEVLYELGETSAAELARNCLVTRQALTAPLNELERRGLVHRPEPSTAVRVRPITLTAAGRELAETARRRVREAERRSIASFPPDDLARFRGLLARHAAAWEDLARDGGPPGDRPHWPAEKRGISVDTH
ncbi:MarR family transcriptional regulator [Nonomuraea sp. NPDC026600]|uniref:MarR family winged helix-turn-helix transcriptional regulator n=1 Tax=Nonomuraea sp. NPDC026600 TaxID=3155363 RepID=UPI0033FD824C